MRKIIWMVWLCGAAVCSGQWYFEAGPWVRDDMDISVSGGSRAANEGAQAMSPGTQGGTADVASPYAGDDGGTAQILRTYEDGYVGPSGWPWAQTAGSSQYFGYENAAQYNSSANTLTFASTTHGEDTRRRTETRLSSGPAGWSDAANMDGIGARVTMGYTFTANSPFDWSLQVQMGWLDGIDASFLDRTAWSQQVEWTTWESHMERLQTWAITYDTLDNPSFPAAPYAMTDPSGVGPMISDRPVSLAQSDQAIARSDRLLGRRQATALSRVSLETEADLLSLSLGPRLRFHLAERLSVILQAGATLNLLDADLSRTETFSWEDGGVLGTWSDRASEQEWLWGATVSAGLQFDMTENLYLHAAGGYDWVEDCTLAIGPDRVRMDLDGYRAEVALGWRFGR